MYAVTVWVGCNSRGVFEELRRVGVWKVRFWISCKHLFYVFLFICLIKEIIFILKDFL